MAYVSSERQREIFDEEGFTRADVDRMEEALRDPALSDEDRGKLLYALVNAGRMSVAEVERYAADLGLDAEDVQKGGQAVHENADNARVVLDRVNKWYSVLDAQQAIGQGGYSNSDEIIDQLQPALEFFDQSHKRFQGASKLVDFAPEKQKNEPSKPTDFDINAATGGEDETQTASYEHAGVDPKSLREGLTEFRGIDFATFRADSGSLEAAAEKVAVGRDALAESWKNNTEDWTGAAKESAKRADESLAQGADKLSESLKKAGEGVGEFSSYLEDNVQKLAQRIFDVVKDGTLAGLTLAQVDMHIENVKTLPKEIEGIKEYRYQTNEFYHLEQKRENLKNSQGALYDICADYDQKARTFHNVAKEHLLAIEKEYAEAIGFLGEQLGAGPFAGLEVGGTIDKSAHHALPSGGPNATPGAGIGGSSGAASPELSSGGAGTSAVGGEASVPEGVGRSGLEMADAVTGEELETDSQTGEAFPIDPVGGDAVEGADVLRQFTIERGDNTLTLSEPDSNGQMTVSLENADGGLSEYELDFGEEYAAAQSNMENGSASRLGIEEGEVYLPGEDGKIRIEGQSITIVAERPEGPNGPTLVTVDDREGGSATYTLGGGESEGSAPHGAEKAEVRPNALVDGFDEQPTGATRAQGGDGAGSHPNGTDPMETTPFEGGSPSPALSGDLSGNASNSMTSASEMSADDGGESGTSATTRPQAVGAEHTADGVGKEANSDSSERSASSGVGLGATPGGDTAAGVSAGPGSGGGMGMMGGIGGTGGGGQSGDEERASSAYPIHGDLFDVVTNAVRISGTIGDLGTESAVRFTR
ncbi:hypothetical protein [Saccharomonospora iraqiensis]|uniref:hypothetical protein n=1 Tax=Saccharomonospora iraqiensis TaxID=52698 RepID=UPI00040ACC93|nr:hypothetical protein [Saccharomonospora iraqiensis]